jgi:nucleoside-diphosphate-sugar epimerase
VTDAIQHELQGIVAAESKKGSVKRRLPHTGKLQKKGWKHETSRADGLKKTLEWYRKNPKKAEK